MTKQLALHSLLVAYASILNPVSDNCTHIDVFTPISNQLSTLSGVLPTFPHTCSTGFR